MYRILRFARTGKNGRWQSKGDTIATYATHGEAQAELDRLRIAANGAIYYRIQCDASPAMLAYRDALTDCERGMNALQHATDDRDRELLARTLVTVASRLHAASVARLSELEG